MTTRTPADRISAVTLTKTRAFWPVSFSIETPHQDFAVVKLSGYTGYFIAEWTGRCWETTDPSSATVADAQSRVRARVALREFR